MRASEPVSAYLKWKCARRFARDALSLSLSLSLSRFISALRCTRCSQHPAPRVRDRDPGATSPSHPPPLPSPPALFRDREREREIESAIAPSLSLCLFAVLRASKRRQNGNVNAAMTTAALAPCGLESPESFKKSRDF